MLLGNYKTDTDVDAFVTACNGDSTPLTNHQISVVFWLVTELKRIGVWSKLLVVYPFIGGTAFKHKFNLKDARDLDVAYRLTFSGSFTHNSTGVVPASTGSNYARTYLLSGLINTDSSYSFYSQTNSTTTADIEIGMSDGNSSGPYYLLVIKRSVDNATQVTTGDNGLYTTSLPSFDTRGMFVGVVKPLIGGYTFLLRNGEILANTNTNSLVQGTINKEMYVFSYNANGSAPNGTRRTSSFIHIGNSMTLSESIQFSKVINNYQSLLGRNPYYT